MRRLVLAVAVVATVAGALWATRFGADKPQDAYSMAFPPSWKRVESNKEWNHAKVRAPTGYGAIVIGARDSFFPDDRSALQFRDAQAYLDSIGVDAIARIWKAGEESDGRAECEVLGVRRVEVDGEPAIEVHYRLTVKATGAIIVIRSVHAMRNRRWFAFQFATSAHDEARFAAELLASERSIRWVP